MFFCLLMLHKYKYFWTLETKYYSQTRVSIFNAENLPNKVLQIQLLPIINTFVLKKMVFHISETVIIKCIKEY